MRDSDSERCSRILEQLLQPRKYDGRGIDAEYDCHTSSPGLTSFEGCFIACRPGHLGDVHQPLNDLLQLNKGAVVGPADAPARTRGANG